METKSLEKNVVTILTDKLSDEFAAERFYIAAYNWCKLNGFDKASEYYKGEASTERSHQHLIMSQLTGWNANPVLPTIDASPTFSSIIDVLEQAYKMEYDLYLAYEQAMTKIDDKDYACKVFLMPFLEIQNASVIEVADMMKKVEGVTDTATIRLLEEHIF